MNTSKHFNQSWKQLESKSLFRTYATKAVSILAAGSKYLTIRSRGNLFCALECRECVEDIWSQNLDLYHETEPCDKRLLSGLLSHLYILTESLHTPNSFSSFSM